ncbi:alpha/beta hydrolase [Tessaracoccus antarcticus]|uniref:Alpha/beta hydrolase n=1 Tax=Tessaracoccus antarcticus TaxID=2479848 RepID=A0A3M0G8G1_9ACTN|nr:alpha/beta hydrolase [Tessaracoccus antarcticus]RMB61194.1 alpha/beta hydrolase [Tessaracoccus antarcticus]
MRNNWVGWAQGATVVIAVVLVASFFVLGMAGGSTPFDPPATKSSAAPSTQTPSPVDPSDPHPGVPAVKVADHATWKPTAPLNPDRQLGGDPNPGNVQLPSAAGDDLAAYWTQPVAWKSCGEQLCATVKAPLDWDDPGRSAVDIAMRKVPSKNPTRGPLFVNPGGPGFGGQDFARNLGTDKWSGYDIIGWDPRGTGKSTTVQCGTTEQTDAVFELDGSPDDAAEERALETGWAEFARQCRAASGELLDHLTTIENVRDLDLLRHLVGAEKLNYVGVSYGTYVGAVYAELFPDRAGRLVLDSAVDITDDEASASQSEGFELALRNYATWCAKTKACTLGDSADEVVDGIATFLAGLDANPIAVGDRSLTQSLGATGVALFLYSDEQAYPGLTYVLTDAMDGRAGDLLKAADELNGRGADGYETVAYAFPATRCVDWADEGIEATFDFWEENKAKSPVFATNMGVDFVCETWTADPGPQLKLTAKGAPPILVVGTTGDSATPYEHAVSMAKQLESGVLLTFEGAGHGSVTGGNKCVNAAVTKYLEDGVPPKDGATCS